MSVDLSNLILLYFTPVFYMNGVMDVYAAKHYLILIIQICTVLLNPLQNIYLGKQCKESGIN